MSKLAVIFPGVGYTASKPLLYYGLDLACEAGYEQYRKLEFTPVHKGSIRGNEAAMRDTFTDLYAQAKEQLADIEWSQYEDVLFVSKSIGTIIAAAYAAEHNLQHVNHVLYTPLKYTFEYEPANAIAFIGTADAWSDYREVVNLAEAAGIPITVYEGCNHSLETECTEDNLKRLQNIMQITAAFINAN